MLTNRTDITGTWEEECEDNNYFRTVYIQTLDEDLQVVHTNFIQVNMEEFDDED